MKEFTTIIIALCAILVTAAAQNPDTRLPDDGASATETSVAPVPVDSTGTGVHDERLRPSDEPWDRSLLPDTLRTRLDRTMLTVFLKEENIPEIPSDETNHIQIL